MKNKFLYFARVFLIALLLGACGGTPTPTGDEPNLEVNEMSVIDDTVAEVISLNNCGNPANVKQVSQRAQAITIGGGAEIGASGGVVSGSVEAKYSSTKGVSKSITVEAAPNTNMKFILLWAEKVREGTVTAEGESGQATYRVSVPISVELVSAEDLGCPNTPTSEAVSSPTPDLEPASPTPAPAYSCDLIDVVPQDNTQIRRGKSFKVEITIVNSGSTVWPEDLDLVISSNPYGTIDPPTPFKNIPRLQPGDQVTIGPFDATAPRELGNHVVAFKLGDGFCWPYVAFEVVK